MSSAAQDDRSARGGTARRVLAVANLTLREALRKRMVLAGAIMALGFLALYATGLHFAAKDILTQSQAGPTELIRRGIAAQMLYVGLFPAAFLVAFTTIFASAGTLSGDVESGIVYGILARPIRRTEFVVGKALGLAIMLATFTLALNGAVVVLARALIDAPLTNWPAALALFVLEPMPLLALAVLGSARLPTLANGVLCVALWGLGFIGGLIEQLGGVLKNGTLSNIGIISSLLMPLDALHRMALANLIPAGLLFQQNGVPGMGSSTTPSAWTVVYALLYVVAMIALAARVFTKRDL